MLVRFPGARPLAVGELVTAAGATRIPAALDRSRRGGIVSDRHPAELRLQFGPTAANLRAAHPGVAADLCASFGPLASDNPTPGVRAGIVSPAVGRRPPPLAPGHDRLPATSLSM